MSSAACDVNACDAAISPLENIVQGISAEYTNSGSGTVPPGDARMSVNISVKTSIIASGWTTAQRMPSRDCL